MVFHSVPLVLLAFLIILHTISGYWLVFRSPFESRIDKIINGLNEMLLFFIMIFTMAFAMDNRAKFMTEERKLNLGWAVIGFSILTIFVSFFMMMIENVFMVINLIKRIKQKKNKVAPKDFP